jgi:uncharacterized protein (TIGR00255 family)
MIKSMTGFGQVNSSSLGKEISIEVKSLNSKFLDLNLKLPKKFSEKETEVRNIISNRLERGKISVSIDVQSAVQDEKIKKYDEELFAANYAELKKLAGKVNAPADNLFSLALNATEAMQNGTSEQLDPAEWEMVVNVLNGAIDACEEFRVSEGKALESKLILYIESISNGLKEVEKLDPLRVERVRKKIKEGITDFFGNEGFDPNRLEQEIIFYIEKLDIHEERVRLQTHLTYFIQLLKEKQSNGKKLGFLAQELGREINTIGSKANDAAIQKFVVDMKEELEKIKEQLNNVL